MERTGKSSGYHNDLTALEGLLESVIGVQVSGRDLVRCILQHAGV